MALNIFSSQTSSAANSSSKSSSQKTSSTDLFAQGMAAASKQSKSTQAKQAAAAKPAARPKPAAKAQASDDDSHSKSSAAKSSAAGKPTAAAQSNSSASAKATQAAQSGQDDHGQAAATDCNPDAVKGRAPVRTTPKNSAPQSAAAAKANATAADPGADDTNSSGLSLIQMLARSLGGDDKEPVATDSDTAAPTVAVKSDDTQATSDDPNAIALAAFSQALAAALAKQQTAPANTASAQSGDTTSAITGATGGHGAMEDLMTALARDVAADAKGKSDDGASQFNVDTTNNGAGSTASTDTTALGPNAVAHLGVASHFAAQHLRNDGSAADLKSPVGSSAWEDEIGTHLTWMSQKGLETGSLRVSPEHLGPVEVNISVKNGDASVWFAANHPDTRAALEQALPKLREMFASQGMNLADSGVSRQSVSQQGSRNQGRSGSSQSVSGVSAVGGVEGASAAAPRINLGLVDTYA